MGNENVEMTSSPNGKITWKRGKGASHVCTKEELIDEIHDTLFKDEGLVEEVTLINERQKKALGVLANVESELKDIAKDLAEMKGRKAGEGISFGWAVTLITIAMGIGAFIMNLLKK